jgi:hypothetical protein
MKGSFNYSIAYAEGQDGHNSQVVYNHGGTDIVSFFVAYFPGQCGARILYGFNFTVDNEEWWQDFTDDLKLWANDHCCKLVASAVDVENGPSVNDYARSVALHKLLTTTQWEHGSSAENPNSGNCIRVFELTVE